MENLADGLERGETMPVYEIRDLEEELGFPLLEPAIVGQVVEAGVPWQAIVVGTEVAMLPLALLYALADMPTGHHELIVASHRGLFPHTAIVRTALPSASSIQNATYGFRARPPDGVGNSKLSVTW